MPPNLGPRLPPEWAGVPARMATADFAVWQRARGALSLRVEAWHFDVGLGEGLPSQHVTTPDLRAALAELGRKRIDAVGIQTDAWLLVELRHRAGPGALGALLLYRALWERDPPDTKPVRALLVAGEIDPDTHLTAIHRDLEILVFPPG